MYRTGSPELSNPEVGWNEFNLDYTDCVRLEGYMLRLQRILNGLNNAKTIHDFDTIIGLRSTIIPIPTTNDRRLRPVTK